MGIGASAQEVVLPKPQPPFQGAIGRTVKDSKPDFPKGVEAPQGAPNVLLILTDDVGFGASSPFGGPIATPSLQRLADSGLRYNTFHTTALCSPTRAALITGRNHHTDASGVITEMATGYPGYNSLMPRSSGSIGEGLRENGYNTSWFGKMHNVPDWMSSQAGPFDLWPSGLGFEYFYGFLGGETDQWHPALFENTRPIVPGPDLGNPNYILDHDLADKAIGWMQMQHALAPNKPWFLYYATGTAHAPHHAPKDWIAKYKGQFDQGWDKVREETLARQIKLGIVPANTGSTCERPTRSKAPSQPSVIERQGRSFGKDPPNATVSVLSKDGSSVRDVVVVLKSPKMDVDKLTFDVQVLEGDLTGADGPASVFIDIIGRRFTPLSFGGVARRTAFRGAWYRGAAVAGAAAAGAAAYYHPYGYPPPACGYYPYPPCY
jgi:arylsulfatase